MLPEPQSVITAVRIQLAETWPKRSQPLIGDRMFLFDIRCQCGLENLLYGLVNGAFPFFAPILMFNERRIRTCIANSPVVAHGMTS